MIIVWIIFLSYENINVVISFLKYDDLLSPFKISSVT